MIVREYYKTRKDGVKLYRTYSNDNKYIRKINYDEEYIEAIDVENTPYTYAETEKDIKEEKMEQWEK